MSLMDGGLRDQRLIGDDAMSNATSGEEDSSNASFIYVLNIVGEMFIAFTSVLGNGLVLVLIVRDKQLQTVTNYFIASLAAADLLVGALGIPCVLVAWHGYPRDFTGCLIVNTVIVTLTQISIFGLLIIAIERFVAIKEPFRYKELCTGKIAAICVSVTWCFATVIGLIPLFGWNLGPTDQETCSFTAVIDLRYMVYCVFLGFVLVPLLCMFVIYGYIFHVVRKQKRQIACAQPNPSPSNLAVTQSLQRETKAAKWFAIVILVFTLCWLPIHIMNAVSLATSKTCSACLVLAILLSHANSAVNPLLYAYGNAKFRAALLRMMGESQSGSSDVDLFNGRGTPSRPSITLSAYSDPGPAVRGFSRPDPTNPSFHFNLSPVPE